MFIKYVHLLIEAVYLAAPVLLLIRARWLRVSQGNFEPLQRFRLTAIAGMMIGVLICIVYSVAFHGRLLIAQVMLTGYLATALMLILQGFDRCLWISGRWLLQLDKRRTSLWYDLRATLGLLLRAALIFSVGLPYVLAVALTYRPRVVTLADPRSMYQWKFEPIVFPAMDGTHIAGWWIPAAATASDKTVVLCPGSNTDRASQLALVKHLIPAGYNVLVFDFRGHGESAGQLCSFGDLERQDVLGAVRWLRENHPDACRRLMGLGVSTGGAALLAAAADPSPEGQNIDAIAVYATFDRLDSLTDSFIRQYIPMPMGWFVQKLGLPLASYQVGSDLRAFAPADAIKLIWPRPVLIIHGLDDEFIPFEEGQNLYDSAMEPKMRFWINRCGHAGAMKSDAAANLVRKYFDDAQQLL